MKLNEAKEILKKAGYLLEGSMSLEDKINNAKNFNSWDNKDEETRIEMGKEDLLKKPEQIRAKIVEGRVNKLMAGKVLLEQPFIKNPDITVGQLIEGKLTVTAFTRYMLGEGLEKRQDNFAEEVMSQVKG